VTLRRLRAARAADDGARLLVQESAGDLTADRVDTNTPLAIGDRVRLTIESSNNGYLYVIDRELYADGTKSDPYLIFPTSRTRDGDNAVRGGRLVDIPGQREQEGNRVTWTKQEQAAAADKTRLLTQEDPAPQTLFRIAAKQGSPVLVQVKLPYAATDR
jgi:hypothetical protein